MVLESVFLIGESQLSWAEGVVESLIPVTFQVVILLGAWAVVWSGAASIVVWLLRELSGSVGQVGVTLARILSLLLGVVTFFFLAAEVWQSVGKLRPVSYTAVMLLFVGLGAVFLSSRSQLDLDALFFVVLGFLSVDVATAKAWIQGTPHVMFTLDLLGEDFALTREHVKVAGFLAVFSGFYFAVVSATDAHLRAGLRDTAEEAVREAYAARVALLHRRPGSVTE